MDDALFGQIYNLIRGSKLKKSVTHILPQSLLSLTDWLRLGQDWIDWRSNLSLSTSTLLIRIKQTEWNQSDQELSAPRPCIQRSVIIEKKRPSNRCHWHCFCQPMLVLPPSLHVLTTPLIQLHISTEKNTTWAPVSPCARVLGGQGSFSKCNAKSCNSCGKLTTSTCLSVFLPITLM